MNPKILRTFLFCNRKGCHQLLLVTKLTAIFVLIASLQVTANKGFGQKISISAHDKSIKEVFSLIEVKTDYVFFFNYDLLKDAKMVTIELKDADIEEVMKACLKDQPLEYRIVDKTITITKRMALEKTTQSAAAGDPVPQEVRGVVRAENGDPLVGASVIIRALGKSAMTNEKGEFILKDVSIGTHWVEISFVGYEGQRKQVVVSNDVVKIFTELKQSTSILDETQVIAYGTTSRRFNVGNVATVKGEDIAKQPVSNPLLALEGRVPGLFITQANGLPGGPVAVRIQGRNSIARGNEPFFVIDGVPYYSQLPSTGADDILSNSGSPFSYINPVDIESVEILKDADATAIFGSRAANGAILITTKKGKSGATKVDINLQNGWGHVTRKIKMLNTQQYLEMRHEAFKNDGKTPGSGDYDINGVWDSTRYTDWQETLIGGTAQYTSISGSVSGGTNNIQYTVGGTYHRETTVFPGNFSDKQVSIHFNLNTTSANQRFRFLFSGNYLVDNNHLPSTDLTGRAIQQAPDAPSLYRADGNLNWAPNLLGNSSWTNPLSYIYQLYKNKTSNLLSNAILSYRILAGLEVKASFGYTNMQTNDFVPYPLLSVKPENRPNTSRSATFGNRNLNSWIIEPQVIYKRSSGNGKMDLLIGSTIHQTNSSSGAFFGSGYNNDQILENIGAATSFFANATVINQYKYNALFGRLNYNWQDKYILDLNARRDGSSRFGSQNQFHNFWSVGGAWLFVRENSTQKPNLLSFGKVKVSYGTTGSDQIADYSFLSFYNIINAGVPYQNSIGLVPAGISNPYLQWEETHKLQLGLELSFFKNRLFLTATYARNRSSNQLLQYALPSIVGFTGINRNFPATVQNTSWEFTLNATNVKSKSLVWTSSFNLTIPRNKLIAFPNLSLSTYTNSLSIGKPLNFMRVYHSLGVDATTGQYQFLDNHGNPTTTPVFPADAEIIINPFPRFYGGLGNSIQYKNFQIDFLFQYVKQIGQNLTFYNGSYFPGQFSTSFSNQPVTVLNRWRKNGDVVPIAKYSTTSSQYTVVSSDYFLNNDGSFARLKNLSISWQLPSQWKRKSHLQNCRIYIQGQNLLTITNFKGMDPENQSYSSLPPLRFWTFGMQMGL